MGGNLRKKAICGLAGLALICNTECKSPDYFQLGLTNAVGIKLKNFRKDSSQLSNFAKSVTWDYNSKSPRDIAREGKMIFPRIVTGWYLKKDKAISFNLGLGGWDYTSKAKQKVYPLIPLESTIRDKTKTKFFVLDAEYSLKLGSFLDDIDINLFLGAQFYKYKIKSKNSISFFGTKMYEFEINKEGEGFTGYVGFGLEFDAPFLFPKDWRTGINVKYHLWDDDAEGFRIYSYVSIPLNFD